MPKEFDPQDASTDQDTKYRFFPVVRRGYPPAQNYSASDAQGESAITAGGSLTVSFDVETPDSPGTPAEERDVDIDMYGPGYVDGIDQEQVVRREPEEDTTNFPPNYLATVEFDAPDLPWVFSPVGRRHPDHPGRRRQLGAEGSWPAVALSGRRRADRGDAR
jgi:hypothetical protein